MSDSAAPSPSTSSSAPWPAQNCGYGTHAEGSACVANPTPDSGSAIPSIPSNVQSACVGTTNNFILQGTPGAYVISGPLQIEGGAGWKAGVFRTQQGLPSFFSIQVGINWNVELSTDSLGIPLNPGVYNNVQRAAFTDPNRPGLDVGGDGRGCNQVTGSFQILDSVLEGASDAGQPRVSSITAVFEEHCEGGPNPVYGCVHFQEAP